MLKESLYFAIQATTKILDEFNKRKFTCENKSNIDGLFNSIVEILISIYNSNTLTSLKQNESSITEYELDSAIDDFILKTQSDSNSMLNVSNLNEIIDDFFRNRYK